MKKVISFVSAVVLSVGVMASAAFAADTAEIKVASKSDAVVGESVELDVSISGNTGFAAANLELVYDNSALELTKVESGVLGGYFETNDNYISIANAENITDDGVMFTATFKVLAAGTSSVSVKLGGVSGGAFADVDENSVDVSFTSGTVTAVEPARGFAVTVDNKTGSENPATVSLVSGNLYNGETTFTVECDNPCAVMYTTDGETYTAVACVTDDSGSRTFTINVTEEMTVVVALKGDFNLDGAVNSRDALLVNRADADTLSALVFIVADANGDGAVNSRDAILINRGLINW